jgi:hypothetical protein
VHLKEHRTQQPVDAADLDVEHVPHARPAVPGGLDLEPVVAPQPRAGQRRAIEILMAMS